MIIYAVDDEPLQLKLLVGAIIEAASEAEIHDFSCAEDILDELENGVCPDVAFLDIELPGIGGIELAKQLKIKSPKTWIVFCTGFSQYAVEAYAIHARGYIMKPVTAERVKMELSDPELEPLRKKKEMKIHAKCFGNFEVFADNDILKFERSKTKELLAYLIDRNGATVNTGTLCGILWEDKPDTMAQRNYLRKLVTDLSKTLEAVGAQELFIKSRNAFAIDTTKIDCDYYRFLMKDPDAINSYNGEYMTQYSWSELTLGRLE